GRARRGPAERAQPRADAARRRRRPRRGGPVLSRALLLALLLGGCYSPSPAGGALLCSTDGHCPKGYSCQQGGCWKDGTSPPPTVADTCSGPVPARTSSSDTFPVDTSAMSDDFSLFSGCAGRDLPGRDAFF